MADHTKIEWAEATWNPIRGTKGKWFCTKVSEGCKHCYAETFNVRMGGPLYRAHKDEVRLDMRALQQPLKWKGPRRIFVCSMTDLFMEEVSADMIRSVFGIMERARQHTFLVLTKRAERMATLLPHLLHPPLPNVMVGVSVENQERAEERIPFLLRTPAAKRFLSVEPLLGPINVRKWLSPCSKQCEHYMDITPPFKGHHPWINWVIIGGESGPKARPMHLEWAVRLLEDCRHMNVPCFFKQTGTVLARRLGLKHLKGGNFDELPGYLSIRQFPEVTA